MGKVHACMNVWWEGVQKVCFVWGTCDNRRKRGHEGLGRHPDIVCACVHAVSAPRQVLLSQTPPYTPTYTLRSPASASSDRLCLEALPADARLAIEHLVPGLLSNIGCLLCCQTFDVWYVFEHLMSGLLPNI
eukprot:177488-Chlamydomonas_euryale.AAC.1